jgi:uncharacterized membrane protein
VVATSAPSVVVAESQPTTEPASSWRRCERLIWPFALGLLALQLVGMLVFSTVQYQRFNLTNDFAGFSQAWVGIAHGHLSPFVSAWGLPYWRNDFELLMWPLAALFWVYPHTVVLLWLQDVAVVSGALVALAWVRDSLTARGEGQRQAAWILGLVTALLIVGPWSWFTIGFDFHFEVFAAVFALLAAWDMWAGRYRRLMIWVPLTLLSCAAPGALLVIAVGLAALLGRRTSRAVASVVVVAGFSWLLLASGLGAMNFARIPLSSMYGYLSGHPTGHFGIVAALEGFVLHPARAADMFGSHIGYVAGYVAAAGVLGLRSRWGLVPAVLVLVPSAVNANIGFIHFWGAFQSWPAVLFLVVGTAMALHDLLTKADFQPRVLVILGVCTFALAATITGLYAGELSSYIDRVSPATARTLAEARGEIAPGTEIVVQEGVIGRFAAGRVAYPYLAEGEPERYVVTGHPIVFVLAPDLGRGDGLAPEVRQAIRYVGTGLHATLLKDRSGIWEFEWSPKVGTTSVVLP